MYRGLNRRVGPDGTLLRLREGLVGPAPFLGPRCRTQIEYSQIRETDLEAALRHRDDVVEVDRARPFHSAYRVR